MDSPILASISALSFSTPHSSIMYMSLVFCLTSRLPLSLNSSSRALEKGTICSAVTDIWPLTDTSLRCALKRPPSHTLNTVSPAGLLMAWKARSLMWQWGKSSRLGEMAMLNFRGRLERSMFPFPKSVIMFWRSMHSCVGSISSWGSIPAIGLPVMLRTLSMPLCLAVMPRAIILSMMTTVSSTGIPRSWMLARVVMSPQPLVDGTSSPASPYVSMHSPKARICSDVNTWPGTRNRIMHCPGVFLRRWKIPFHFARWSRSSTLSSSQVLSPLRSKSASS
mmetsp:Transcript_10513/g.29912  ORF Transcript_10513/g.29912 Transcript_10513/m.29912 type:complete len:279 (-) Transcript_10513:362-1198(-)